LICNAPAYWNTRISGASGKGKKVKKDPRAIMPYPRNRHLPALISMAFKGNQNPIFNYPRILGTSCG